MEPWENVVQIPEGKEGEYAIEHFTREDTHPEQEQGTMRIQDNGTSFTIWASAYDTSDWASKPGGCWPCSELSGRRFMASFDDNGLVDLSVDGKDAPDDLSSDELNFCVSDLARDRIPKDHPCYFVAIGQFEEFEA